jgi:hypothetical protein
VTPSDIQLNRMVAQASTALAPVQVWLGRSLSARRRLSRWKMCSFMTPAPSAAMVVTMGKATRDQQEPPQGPLRPWSKRPARWQVLLAAEASLAKSIMAMAVLLRDTRRNAVARKRLLTMAVSVAKGGRWRRGRGWKRCWCGQFCRGHHLFLWHRGFCRCG